MNGLVELSYLVATASFMAGLKLMSSPAQAKLGNGLAAAGMFVALLATWLFLPTADLSSTKVMVAGTAIGFGAIGGWLYSIKTPMTHIPQLVSLFNATGGATALLLGFGEAWFKATPENQFAGSILLAGMSIGGLSFTGSIIAYFKLRGSIGNTTQKHIQSLTTLALVAMLGLVLIYAIGLPVGLSFSQLAAIVGFLSLLYGYWFVLPIGGADMPVVISLLNALTGVATSLAGIAFNNNIMISGGIFVGAAGLVLTLLMCKAMNRSIFTVLRGKISSSQQVKEEQIAIREANLGEVAMYLLQAQSVAIVPGFGMAVAQAQFELARLQQTLNKAGKSMHYLIHPVAGRMPGHMNVLLAEADIHYDFLLELEEANQRMKQFDLVIVLGANDVVNPAAERDPSSPLYGMPILQVYLAQQVVVIKRGMSKGYAGVENALFGEPNCSLLFGDATSSIQQLHDQIKSLNA